MPAAIGYNNLLDSLSSYAFTTGTEDSGSPLANCYDHNVYDYMSLAASASPYQIDITLSGSMSANYLAFYKTNLAAVGGSIRLYYDDSGYTAATAEISPTNTKPTIVEFPSQSSADWRIQIDNKNTDAVIGDIKFGSILDMPFGCYIGHTPIDQARTVDYSHAVAEGGLSLGRHIVNQGVEARYNFQHMTDSFVRSDWMPFVEHAERYPFYLAWDIDNYPAEVGYCVSNGQIAPPVQSNPGRADAQLQVRGFVE